MCLGLVWEARATPITKSLQTATTIKTAISQKTIKTKKTL